MLALAIVLLAALAWPGRALVRRRFQSEFALQGRPLQAWRLSRIFAWTVIGTVAGWFGLMSAISADIANFGGPLDWLIHLLRIVTPIAAFGLFLASAWHLTLSIQGRRRWTMILGALTLLVAAAVLVWVTIAFHLYGFGMVY